MPCPEKYRSATSAGSANSDLIRSRRHERVTVSSSDVSSIVSKFSEPSSSRLSSRSMAVASFTQPCSGASG